jgi:hypothetical protein
MHELLLGLLALAALALLGCPLAVLARPKDGDAGAILAGAPGMGAAAVACAWLISAYGDIRAWQTLGALALVAAGWAVWRLRRGIHRSGWVPAGLAVVGGMAVLAWRNGQVRGLAFPPWVDSVHHALVVRKMLELGQVPRDLAPYLPGPFFYHFAFHSLTASLVMITGAAIPHAMLSMGQVLQVGVAFSIYRLGWTLWGRRLWAAVAAVLVTFVAQMPAHYTAWGKYPLLTAMVLLPLAISLTLEIVRDGARPGRVFGLAIVVAGMITAHYFTALTLALFLATAVIQAILENRRGGSSRAWIGVLLGGGLGLALVALWIAWVWGNAGRFVAIQTGESFPAPDQAYYLGYLGYLWALTGPFRNRLLLALALPGLILALRRSALRGLGVWTLLLLALGSPWGWRLQPFSPDRVLIMLWLPAVLLTTETLAWLAGRLAQVGQFAKLPRMATGIVIAGVVVWCLWGASETSNLTSDRDVLATEADARALAWVQDNVPADARFFIGVTLWPPYGYRGTDGGWWLLPMTGRQTVLPPALYGLGDSREVERVNALAGRAAAISGCSEAFWDLVAEARLTHVYFNERQGTLQPRGFDGCPAIEKIYAADGVSIYRLLWLPTEENAS